MSRSLALGSAPSWGTTPYWSLAAPAPGASAVSAIAAAAIAVASVHLRVGRPAGNRVPPRSPGFIFLL